jgi:hypothetical protein
MINGYGKRAVNVMDNLSTRVIAIDIGASPFTAG